MKKHWSAGLFIVPAALVAASLAACTARPQTLAPHEQVVNGERVILEVADSSVHTGPFEMSLSPDGRHLLFLRNESVEVKKADGTTEASGVEQAYLLDVGTGEQIKLPFKPFCPDHRIDAWMDNTFTADGNYIHVVETGADDQGEDRPWVLLYDIRNRALRTIKIGPTSIVVSDDSAENLLVTTQQQGSHDSNVMEWEAAAFQLMVTPIAGGAVEKYPINGLVRGMCRKDRAIVLGFGHKLLGGTGADLSVMDLTRGKALKKFRLGEDWYDAMYLTPFFTGDGRFFCFGDCVPPKDAWLGRGLFPGRRPSVPREADLPVRVCRIWDSVKDRLTTLRDAVAVCRGPAPSSALVMLNGNGEQPELILMDCASGTKRTLAAHPAKTFVCAAGKHAVYALENPDGGVKLVLVEIALPEPAR